MAHYWNILNLKKTLMKNVFIVCVVFFAVVFKTYSQATVGVRGGILYSHIKGPLPSENIQGWEAGVFSKAEIVEDEIYFQPEIDYSMKGGKVLYHDSTFTLRN